MLSTAAENLMQMETMEGRKKIMKAGSAARSAFKWVMEDVPFPANAVIAPIAAGAAFAGVMAFEEGGKVPGTGPVPSVNHGGETVVTKALTDRVEQAEGRGKGRGITNHITILPRMRIASKVPSLRLRGRSRTNK